MLLGWMGQHADTQEESTRQLEGCGCITKRMRPGESCCCGRKGPLVLDLGRVPGVMKSPLDEGRAVR